MLGIGHREVTTHSPILVELLNPHGSHGQSTLFLKHFLAIIGITGFQLGSGCIRVSDEVHLGRVTETTGGRLDILVSDGSGCTLFIENKIFAGEQANQLTRYHAADPKAHLIYLTLRGDEPTSAPKGAKVMCISYLCHIKRWLESCEESVKAVPRLREILLQYRHLIESLSLPQYLSPMSQELASHILQSAENFAAYRAVISADQAVRSQVAERWNNRLAEIAKDRGLKLTHRMEANGDNYDGWSFINEAMQNENVLIGFEAQAGWGRSFIFGFAWIDHKKAGAIGALLRTHFGSVVQVSDCWPAWTYWRERSELDVAQFGDLLFGSVADEVGFHTDRLLEIFNAARTSLSSHS